MNLVTFYDIDGVQISVNTEEVSSVIELRRGSLIIMKNGKQHEVMDHHAETLRKLGSQ